MLRAAMTLMQGESMLDVNALFSICLLAVLIMSCVLVASNCMLVPVSKHTGIAHVQLCFDPGSISSAVLPDHSTTV